MTYYNVKLQANMSPIFIIIFLSFIQGSTEFLPISSTGHLLLVEYWLRLPHNTITFDIALNLGTLLATIIYFRKEVYLLKKEKKNILIFKTKDYNNLLVIKLVISTIPVVIVGYIFVHFNILCILHKNYLILAINLIIFGVILYFVDIFSKRNINFYQITLKNALIIGLVQCLALIPGVSRSGSTITAARIQKINRQDSVKFSFLIAIPSALGAVTLTTLHSIKNNITINYFDVLLGVILTFIFGIIFIHILLKFISKYNFTIFMIYRVILGVLIFCLVL